MAQANSYPTKSPAVAADKVLTLDSAASNAVKQVSMADVVAAGGRLRFYQTSLTLTTTFQALWSMGFGQVMFLSATCASQSWLTAIVSTGILQGVDYSMITSGLGGVQSVSNSSGYSTLTLNGTAWPSDLKLWIDPAVYQLKAARTTGSNSNWTFYAWMFS